MGLLPRQTSGYTAFAFGGSSVRFSLSVSAVSSVPIRQEHQVPCSYTTQYIIHNYAVLLMQLTVLREIKQGIFLDSSLS
jgi:hypothetical protein